jgi:hypothetical protein
MKQPVISARTPVGFQCTFYLVCGFDLGGAPKMEVFSTEVHTPESCRKEFLERYYAAGIRGVTVRPLYEMRRYH